MIRSLADKYIAEKQVSAIAYFVESPKFKAKAYLGTHAHPGSGANPRATGIDSLFDLASLTKILSTLSLLFIAESEQKIQFNDPVQSYFVHFPSPTTTILDLLTHRSGLPAHLEYFRRFLSVDGNTNGIPLGDQSKLADWICESKLESVGNQVYSDLGFLLLGLLLEKIYQKPLPQLFHEKIASKLKLNNTGFVTLPHCNGAARMFGLLAPQDRFVATEQCPWRKKTLQGEVHDDNTWALGGYAGHAGLFSTLEETVQLFRHLWHQAKANPLFLARKHEVPGIFSFGMMTYPGLRPFPGPAFADSLGHTGFVGTSIWFHEQSESLVAVLANRVHPSRKDDRWIQSRLEFHKALWEEAGL